MPTIEQYRECSAKGLTEAETARELGVSREAVRQIKIRHKMPFYTERGVRRGAVIDAHSKGLSTEEISKLLGISLGDAYRHQWLARLKPHFKPKSKYLDALIAAERSGMSKAEFAREAGISYPYASNLCQRFDIKLRDGRRSK